MATTCFFEETVTDKEDKTLKLDVEFGRSSFYGENLMYLKVDGKGIILNYADGRKLFEAMQEVGAYLGYDR